MLPRVRLIFALVIVARILVIPSFAQTFAVILGPRHRTGLRRGIRCIVGDSRRWRGGTRASLIHALRAGIFIAAPAGCRPGRAVRGAIGHRFSLQITPTRLNLLGGALGLCVGLEWPVDVFANMKSGAER